MLNSTKTWQDKFDEIKIVKANDFGCNEKDKEAMVKLLNDLLIPYKEATKQFISDLRKKDEEDLIKMLEEFETYAYIPEFKKAIQDYYEK